jgi:hypothetical protein
LLNRGDVAQYPLPRAALPAPIISTAPLDREAEEKDEFETLFYFAAALL